ncbi:MAG: hypothetical protein AAFY88_10360, partial [Acidobacteriota bacterium]
HQVGELNEPVGVRDDGGGPHHPDPFTTTRSQKEHAMPQIHAPRTHSRLSAAGPIVAVVWWLLVAAAAAVAQPLSVTSYTPTSGSEGTQVDVFGGPFSTDPDDHAVFIEGGGGLGVVLNGESSTPGQWTGTLGPAASPFFGSLTVWQGQRYVLAPAVFSGISGTAYWIDRTEWFVPRRRTAVGPGLFHVKSGSGGTVGGATSQTGLDVHIDFSLGGGHASRIDLNVMIDGGSSGGNDDPDPGRMVIFGMSFVEGQAPSAIVLAEDLAGALTARFGAFGLSAQANGTTLSISFNPYPVSRGFTVLSTSR